MTSKLERLDTDVRIPYDEEALLSGDPVRIADEWLELIKTLQGLLEKITVVANYSLDLYDGEAIYSRLKLADGSYPLGTWRFIQVGDNWERQVQQVLGVWTFAGRFGLPV